MREFFYPQSVAVIGVSPRPDNLGREIVANLTRFGFNGIIYAVGRSGGVWAGRRIHRSVSDIPDKVDLAVILTPARTVPEILAECGEKGIRRVVVESAGFREYGDGGLDIERQVVEAIRRWEIRLIGPNGLGVINMENGLALPFIPIEDKVLPGDISVITQSGGVGLSIISVLAEENLGLNKFVSAGNMLDVGTEELLDYLIEDDGTRVIVLYLEGIRDGRRLVETARRSSKPILAIKGNIGRLGRAIAASHSASLSDDDRVVEEAFRQAGIARIHNPTFLGHHLKAVRMPPMRGPNLAVVSRSGGHAVLAADACETFGFELPAFPPGFIAGIERRFRASVIKLTNPLDLGDLFDLDVYRGIIEETLRQPDVHGMLLLLTYAPGAEGEAAREVFRFAGEAGRRHDKPVAIFVAAPLEEIRLLKQTIHHPVFTHITEAVRSLRMARDYSVEAARARTPREAPRFDADRARVAALLETAAAQARDPYLHEAAEALACYGIPIVRGVHVHSEEEAAAAARKLGYPVAVKIVSRRISHKSDFGGVQLNLRNEDALLHAYRDMFERIRRAFPEADIEGALVQPMVTGGREMILGGRQDRGFGPVVLVGMGGIFVEILREASVRIAPIDAGEAHRMVDELRGAPILRGARGTQPADVEALVECLLRLSMMLVEFPAIREVDINPVRVFARGEGCLALDARILTAATDR